VAHAEYLRQEGGDDLEVEHIKSDWRQMHLTGAERVMLEWVENLGDIQDIPVGPPG
jgi:hypothetical protein